MIEQGVFIQDDDSHWYFIPAGSTDRFQNLLDRLQKWQADPIDSALADDLFSQEFAHHKVTTPS